MSQSSRDDVFDPDDLEPSSTGEGAQKDLPETDGESAPQTDEGEDQRPNRRQNLGNRVSYVSRKVSQLERLVQSMSAELDSERQRNRAAQSASQVVQHVSEAESTVYGHINAAKARLKAALAEGDADKAADVNLEIAQLANRAARLQEHRDSVVARQQQPEPQPQPGGGVPQQAEHVADWLDTNQDWFNMRPANQTQQILTQRALQIEAELAKKGLELQSPRILAAISQRMHNEFPDYFNVRAQPRQQVPQPNTVSVEVPEAQPRQTMPGASRYAPATAGGTRATAARQVKLTNEEIQAARDMGMTPAQYASMKD